MNRLYSYVLKSRMFFCLAAVVILTLAGAYAGYDDTKDYSPVKYSSTATAQIMEDSAEPVCCEMCPTGLLGKRILSAQQLGTGQSGFKIHILSQILCLISAGLFGLPAYRSFTVGKAPFLLENVDLSDLLGYIHSSDGKK